ncbi:MAG: tripartite tricarboxylate transporter TctB family protein [Pseudomonadota bacterium]
MRPARADLITGLLLMVLGVAALYGGWSMDRLEIRRIHPASIPGLVPMLLGAALTVSAALLLAQAIRAGGHHAAVATTADDDGAARRLLLALALTLGYPLLLIGRMPFEWATGIFVFAFIAMFEWPGRKNGRARVIGLLTALLQAAIVAVLVAWVFRALFLVRLP